VCEAAAGARWLAEGWSMFAREPGPWLLITLVLFVLVLALSVVPLGSLAINLLFPVVTAGIMLGCEAARRGEPLNVSHLFEGFNAPNVGQLVVVGAISLAAGVVIAIVVLIPFLGLGGFAVFRAILAGTPPDLGQLLLPLMLALLLYLALLTPLMMLVWFAPALIVLDKLPAFDAMKLSFSACLKNVVPYLVYGLIGVPLAIAATIPLLLGWFVLVPIVYASTYVSYREIFHAG
jgi:uncharacterized membrane protein